MNHVVPILLPVVVVDDSQRVRINVSNCAIIKSTALPILQLSVLQISFT